MKKKRREKTVQSSTNKSRPSYRNWVASAEKQLRQLLAYDMIPSVWEQWILKIVYLCREGAFQCDVERKKQGGVLRRMLPRNTVGGQFGFWQNILMRELDTVNWYIKVVREKLRRQGRSIREVVSKANRGSDPALFALVATDPRWLYEPWVEKKIKSECRTNSGKFFELLGSALSNRNKKFFRALSSRKGSLASRLSERAIFGHVVFPSMKKHRKDELEKFAQMPTTPMQLLDQLTKEGALDPDDPNHSFETFKKTLERHNLVPTVSRRLSK